MFLVWAGLGIGPEYQTWVLARPGLSLFVFGLVLTTLGVLFGLGHIRVGSYVFLSVLDSSISPFLLYGQL